MRPVDVLVCDADLGAGLPGAGLGPHAFLTAAAQRGAPLHPQTWVEGPKRWSHLNQPSLTALDRLVAPAEAQCRAMARSLGEGRHALALSGDHANAVGWLAGVREAYPWAKVGVVWIDAHGDLHTPGSTPSGNVHGMPLAALLGCSDQDAAHALDFGTLRSWWRWQRVGSPHLWPKLDPADLLMVEIRDLEDAEWARLDTLGVERVVPTQRAVWGVDHVIARAHEKFADHDAVFVSFDVDALDAPLVPGTGTPVEGGLGLEDAHRLLSALVVMPNFVGLEVAEINPLLDAGNRVAEQVAELVTAAWPALRTPAARPTLRHPRGVPVRASA